jgi:hypothetical protein
MSGRPADLGQIQRWMQAVITDPRGIHPGASSESAREHLDVELEEVVTRSQALTGAERLAIYGRAYHLRLLECFRAEFPCLLHALGEELFTRFVLDYLQQYPSTSYTLYHLSEQFPAFLAETRPDADAPSDEREDWPEFMIDLATLERAFNEVFSCPGMEGRQPLGPIQLRTLDEERLLASRMVAVPCLRLLRFRYPVVTYFRAVRSTGESELPAPADTRVAITRRDYAVQLHELSTVAAAFLAALTEDLTIAEAIRAADEDRHTCLELLYRWADAGFFSRLAV